MSARKKWATVHGTSWQRCRVQKRHTSRAAAYRWVGMVSEEYRLGMWSSPCIKVMYDEGNGWQMDDQLNLTKPAD